MKKILSFLLLLSMLIGVLTVPVYAESTNLIPANDGTFESGKHTWTVLGKGGKVEVVNNPDGDGKVLKYSDIPEQSFASPQLDVRKYIQQGVKEPSIINVSMDLYVVGGELSSITRIRTKTPEGFSLCKEDGKAFCALSKVTVAEEEWCTIEFSFEVQASDLKVAEPWNICFDNIYRDGGDVTELYIDNVIFTVEALDVPVGDTDAETALPEDNFVPEENAFFEKDGHAWSLLGSGGKLGYAKNPDGEGRVLAYTNVPEITYATPQLDVRKYIQDNATEECTIYGAVDVYSAGVDFNLLLRIRTKTEEGFSMCENDGINYCTIGRGTGLADTWCTIYFEFEITEDDLDKTEAWNLCFDGIYKTEAPEAFYIDNLYLGLESAEKEEEAVEIPEKTPVSRFNQTLIGTIRWDAFTSSEVKKGVSPHPAAQVAKVLSPKKYHWQAPFFSKVNADDTISFPEYTVETWDKEAEYAAKGGIDYYAYIWYETTDDMSQPRKLHLQSTKKDLVKMAGALERIRSNQTMKELFEAMKDSCYLTLDGRPVVFLYGLDGSIWTKESVQRLRQMAANAGIEKALYIVGMSTTTKLDQFNQNLQKNIDAISWYGVSALATAETYDTLAKRCEKFVTDVGALCNAYGIDFIPAFTTGRDTRARIETGVSWVDGDPNAKEDKDKPYHNWYALPPTMSELEAHMKNVISYANTSPQCKTNIVCSYGWNEHEEGGWFCPTLLVDENGDLILDANGKQQANTERLDTLNKVLTDLGMDPSLQGGGTNPGLSGNTGNTGNNGGNTSAVTPTPEVTPDASNNNEGGFNILYVIIPVAAAVIIAGAIVAVLIIKKKKQQQ